MSLSDKRASFGEKIVDSGDKQPPQTCFAGKSSILNRFKKADPWQKERWIRDSLCCLWTCGGVIIQSKYRMKSFIHLVSFVRIALPTFCFNMDCEYNMHAAFLHGYSKLSCCTANETRFIQKHGLFHCPSLLGIWCYAKVSTLFVFLNSPVDMNELI